MESIEFKGTKYIQVNLPDWDEMARLINRAKGSKKTMGEFANECGISPATFTRIVKQYYKKPLSFEMMDDIAKNALPESEVTIRDFLKAMGYQDEDEYDKNRPIDDDKFKYKSVLTFDEAHEHSRKEVQLKHASWKDKAIYETVLLKLDEMDMGYSAIFVRNPRKYSEIESKFAFDVQVSGIKDFCGGRCSTFSIEKHEPKYVKFIPFDEEEEVINMYKSDGALLRYLIDKYAALFLQDSWEPEYATDIMYTITFFEKRCYKVFCEAMKNVKVNNYMSVLLIDYKNYKIIDEMMIERVDGIKKESVFFEDN
ncbi:MAG: AraC family transcriptional regulator [Lachnospiraceae bacterium]|nr:AraC family transcriptional regulator [Lachnospiraceae bacterium]